MRAHRRTRCYGISVALLVLGLTAGCSALLGPAYRYQERHDLNLLRYPVEGKMQIVPASRGCGAKVAREFDTCTLREQAAHDFDCPADQITIGDSLDDCARPAFGCGKRDIYLWAKWEVVSTEVPGYEGKDADLV